MPFVPRERKLHPSRPAGGKTYNSYDGKVNKFEVPLPYGLERLDFSMTHPRPYRSGGPFLVRKSEVVFSPCSAVEQWATLKWVGTHVPNPIPMQTSILELPSIPDTTMTNMGTKGWDKFKPAAHMMDLGQFLGELKDFKSLATTKGLYSVDARQYLKDLKFSASQARNYGKSYLTREFGWRPFLDDLTNFIVGTRYLNERLRQLRRDNGRTVRRSGTVKVATNCSSVTNIGYGHFTPAVGPYWANYGLGTRTTTTTTHDRFWFSGSFKYYIADIPESPVDLSNLIRMYALKPTPKLVWELTPWSWLADYWGNIGSIMSNISGNAADSLVATYAFVMGTEQKTTEVVSEFTGKSGRKYLCSYVYTRSVKRRRPATPYGFGFDMTGLTTKQVAILGALGLSRT